MDNERTFTQEQAQAMYNALKILASWDLEYLYLDLHEGNNDKVREDFQRCKDTLAAIDSTPTWQERLHAKVVAAGEKVYPDDTLDIEFDVTGTPPDLAQKLVSKIDEMLPGIREQEAREAVRYEARSREVLGGWHVWVYDTVEKYQVWQLAAMSESEYIDAWNKVEAEAKRLNAGSVGNGGA